jgi:hypothetical protein
LSWSTREIEDTVGEREEALQALARGKCEPMELGNHITAWNALQRVWNTDDGRRRALATMGYGESIVNSSNNV